MSTTAAHRPPAMPRDLPHRLAFGVNLLLSGPMQLLTYGAARTEPAAPLQGVGSEIGTALDEMARTPTRLERPVLVLAGYRAWPLMANTLRGQLIRLTSGEPRDILAVSYTNRGRFEDALSVARRRIAAWRLEVARGHGEVDIVGISMGGLVARALASDTFGGPPLNATRVFTLATPHGGARLADRIAPEPAARGMRAGSDLLGSLDAAWSQRGYELTPYAVLNDTWVGATRTTPPGLDPIWTPGSHLLSHFTVSEVPGIMADIARRLRGEPPLAGEACPPPHD